MYSIMNLTKKKKEFLEQYNEKKKINEKTCDKKRARRNKSISTQ